MYQMFYKCQTLKTIYVSDLWDTSKVTSSTDMFRGCTSLVGGNGTAYSSSYTNKTYARIDTADAPGYLTPPPSYKLKTGLAFNALIPSTTTSIVFTAETKPLSASSVAVGVDDSIVGWLDGKTFKISSQQPGKKIIANEDSSYMFCGNSSYGNKTTTTQNLTSIIGLEHLDTSKVTNMSYMFRNAVYKTTSFNLDLSGWNTSKVTDMRDMFNQAGYNAVSWSVGDISG